MIRVSLWTAVFLIVLRVCIGWHFFYEGYGKVKSAYQGKATANEKPFSSEAYFRESEGPFGKVIKRWMGDPDQELINKLTLRTVEGDRSKVSPKELMPEALEKEWNEYYELFAKTFKLSDEQKVLAQTKLDQAKADVVLWLQGVGPLDPKTKEPTKITLKVKRKSPAGASGDFDEEMTVQARTAEFKKKSDDVKALYAEKLPLMGKDVEKTKLRASKTEVNTIRAELQKELDTQTNKLKDSLAELLSDRTAAYAKKADNQDEAPTLLAMLTPMSEDKNPLRTMWEAYAEYAKEYSPTITDSHKAQIDEQLKNAKQSFDRWLADQDVFTGKPLENKEVADWRTTYAAAKKALDEATAEEKALPKVEKETDDQKKKTAALKAKKQDAETDLKLLTTRMQANLKQQSDALKTLLGATLGDVRIKGYAPPDDAPMLGFIPKWKPVEYIDWSTRWFLLVSGALLMVGLFTRLSCFSAAVFLLLTVLTQPSLPWLPVPPNNEGNYLIINKNVIEMFALLALMTTRSGKWCGLDGILDSLFRKA